MKVLSLFDGISCARVALERVGIKVDKYYASEIDRYAKRIAEKNYPDTDHIGDIKHLEVVRDYIGERVEHLGNPYGPCSFDIGKGIDLLIGGSPCQDLSIAKNNRKGLDGERSGLFWEYVRILREVKPKRFILENVASMPQDAKDTITRKLGVEPVMINASLVSAQHRKRLFRVGMLINGKYETVYIPQPQDRGILLKDILQNGSTNDLKSYCITANYPKLTQADYLKKSQGQMVKVGNIHPSGKGMNGNVYHETGKSPTLTTNKGEGLKIIQRSRGFNRGGYHIDKSPTLSSHSWEQNNLLQDGDILRRLTPTECERLQGLPDNYTEGVSKTQRYKMLGNAFNVDVVAHILTYI